MVAAGAAEAVAAAVAGGAPASGSMSAVTGLNRATWTSLAVSGAASSIPPGIVMWGGGGGAPKMAPGTYTVKVTSGAWSETQTFKLKADPRYLPAMTDAQGAEQLRLGNEIGAQIKELYDNLARIRDAKRQASELAAKTGAGSPIVVAAKTLKDQLEAVEADMTQMQGEPAARTRSTSPGAWTTSCSCSSARSSIRSAGWAPRCSNGTRTQARVGQTDAARAAALKTEVAAFNAVATKAGFEPIVVK